MSTDRIPGRRLKAFLLGSHEQVRWRSALTLIALAVYLLFAFVQHGEVMLGLIDREQSNWLTLFNLTGISIFYLLVRSGISARIAPREPSLTSAQMVFAIASITWSYAITGPARGSVLGIMILVLTFGMFGLPPRTAWSLAGLALAGLGCVMTWRALTLPGRYPPKEEVVHFVFALIVLAGSSLVAIQLGRLRARLAAQKVELSKALALNRELATRDALTGLLNRRAMTERIAIETSRRGRMQGPLAIALLDIDYFKRVNDTLGHGAGDEVLRLLGSILAAQLRTTDALARWGGEEFLLLMPDTALADAGIVMERLRAEVAAGAFGTIAPGLKVSFSAGLAELRVGESQDAAIDRADRALYRAKQGGRDRVEVDP